MSSRVVHYTDAPIFGGAEQMIVTVLGGLDRRRWSPILLHHGGPGLGELVERTRALNVQVVEIERGAGRRGIVRFLRQARPALFHAHLNWALACSDGLIAAAWARVPGVLATQQLFAPIQSRRRILRHKLLSMAVDRYLAVSHHMAGMLRKVCLFADRKIRVVQNGIPIRFFEGAGRADLPERLAKRDRPIVLTIARLVQQKGIGFLVDAATQVPEALFAVAGEGPDRAALEAKALANGVQGRFFFLGHRRDVPELLASCDVFVLPSLYEGLPVSVLEAMASAKPVIATDIGGTDEAVQNEVTGLLVPPADAGALALAIQRVLANRPFAERLGMEGRNSVRRKFSSEVVAAHTMEAYEELALGVAESLAVSG